MTIANYKTSMEHFYSICDMALTSCEQQLPLFNELKLKYDAAYITDMRASVAAARAMPGNQVRGAASETMRLQLVAMGDTSRDHFQRTKRYIDEAFAANMQKPQYEAAGQEFYARASNNSWDALESLNLYGSQYVSANQAVLVADGYMPVAFVASYAAHAAAFRAKHQEFMQQEEDNEEGTQAKVTANNLIYDNLMKMLLDGQFIFANNDAIRKQFIYSELLDRVGGVGVAGVRGVITDESNQQPVANAEVHIINTNKLTSTDIDGRYEIKPLVNGIVEIRISAPGYEVVIIHQHEVVVGVVSILNVALVPMP